MGLGQVGLEASLNGLQVLTGGNPGLALLLAAGKSKVLGHDGLLVDNVDTGALELLGELDNVGGVVELTTADQTTGPGEDGGNRVGRGLTALLVLAVVASDGTVGSLGLESQTVRGGEGRGHQTQRAETLGDNVGLDVTVVVCSKLEIQFCCDSVWEGQSSWQNILFMAMTKPPSLLII